MNLPTIVSWMRRAREQRFAIAAFNAVNMETAQAIVLAAELEQAPVILQFSHNAARFASLPMLAAIGRHVRQEATIPVFLHYDHAEDADAAVAALDLGFDSVMLEGARLEFEANIAATERVVTAAHAVGVAVEAELEVVAKEGRAAHVAEASADAAAEFVSRTGCDALVVDVGSHHKESSRDTKLDLDRLALIAASTSVPLVLHGGSGVRSDDLSAAVHRGVAKVNIATLVSRAFTRAVRANLEDPSTSDPRAYLGAGRTAMTQAARTLIREVGTSRRAVTTDA